MSAVLVPQATSAEAKLNAEKLYIPPPGLAFRLLGYASQAVIFSRTDAKPEVWQSDLQNGVNDDQWFTLLPGTGTFAGLYAIKGRKSGMVLYSREQPDPRVGHITGNGAFPDNWFKIEAGQGDRAMAFRLITPSEDLVLYSRTHAEPNFSNWGASAPYPQFDDQHFVFLWEDMKVDKVEYDLDAGRVITSVPTAIAQQTLTNDSDKEKVMTFGVDKGVTNSSSFEYSSGFTGTLGMNFSVGVPIITDGKFTVSAPETNTWGQMTEFTTQYKATYTIKLAPRETRRGVVIVNKGMVDVPYTMYLSSKRDPSVKVQTTGVWHGVSTWALRSLTVHLGSA